ncbi:hypothetical protein MGN70_014531 [Eutypa lata]|nr:hypothetical protein MGN70_014531 [Eutypa lata]
MDSSKAVSPITTIGGWVVVIVIGYIAYRNIYANQNARPLVARQPPRQQRSADVATLASDAKKKAEKAVKPKSKPKPTTTSKEATPPTVNYENWEQDDAADKKADREFARQLSSAHSGTRFNAKKSEDKRHKSIKQSKAEEVLNAPAEKPSAPSSHAGDADDDLSPPTSPPTEAVNGQDVSDMLEPTASGPSVLRLTDTDSVKPKERKAKPLEVVETKKQRQNRKKAEAAKAAREEAEQIRKVQLEQQRRTARVAEGRAAKDGSAFMTNQNKAWTQKPTNGDTIQPLDTFEQQQAQSKPEPTKSATPAATKAKKQENADPWLSGVPSEEEQMEMLRQEESWSEVKTKKKGKKNVASEPSTAPVALTNGTNGVSAAPVSKPSIPAAAVTKRPIITSSSSSFAALTPEETDDNDDVEREWDV